MLLTYYHFPADTLTIEGLNLAKASLFIANKRGDCFRLETECTEETSPRLAVSTVSYEELRSTTFTGACTYSAENFNMIPGNVFPTFCCSICSTVLCNT